MKRCMITEVASCDSFCIAVISNNLAAGWQVGLSHGYKSKYCIVKCLNKVKVFTVTINHLDILPTDLYRIAALSCLSILSLTNTASLSLVGESNFLRLLVLSLLPPQRLSLLIHLISPSSLSFILSSYTCACY